MIKVITALSMHLQLNRLFVYMKTSFFVKNFCYGVGGPDVRNKSVMKKRQTFNSDKEYDKHVSRRFCNDSCWIVARYRYRMQQISSQISYVGG